MPASSAIRDPETFRAVYDEHSQGVYAAALRILGDPARAQDVMQDVFLKLWRKPEKFDARRGQLGPYLKLMARSRALDLWREGQAAGRASDRLKVVVGQAEGRVEDVPCTPPSATRPATPCAPRCGCSRRRSARRSCWPTGAA